MEAFERIIGGQKPDKLPLVLSAEEIERFLDAVIGLRNRVVLATAYAAGLGVSEVARLKVSSIDSKRMLIYIENGKGGRDRFAMLPLGCWRFCVRTGCELDRGCGCFQAKSQVNMLASAASGRPPTQDSLPAGGLRLYREGVEPSGSLRKVSGYISILLSRTSPVARVVYAKCPFDGPEQVLAYLGRYTHRVAIANSRILTCERVRFRCKDYRAGNKSKVMTLDTEEFMHRFLLHVLPKGLRRIRHFGFLANACRAAKLARIRAALEAPEPPPRAEAVEYRERYLLVTASICATSAEAAGRDWACAARAEAHATPRCDT